MTYIPIEAELLQLLDSARLLRSVFPNYRELQPCNPRLEVAAVESACQSARHKESVHTCFVMCDHKAFILSCARRHLIRHLDA